MGEILVADQCGVHEARSVRRIAWQDRWTPDSVSWVRRAPWHQYKGQDDADSDIPVVKVRQPPPLAFQIRKDDAEKHVFTRGTLGGMPGAGPTG